MLKAPAGPLVRQLRALEMHPKPTSTQVDAMVLSEPVGNVLCGPGPLTGGDFGAEIVQHRRREGRLFPAARLIGQGIKPTGEEGLDPEAHGLLVLVEVTGDLGNGPASSGQAHHFQAVTGGRVEARLTRSLLEVAPLVVG